MRVLIDINIILDILLQRAPHVEPAAALWLACEQGRFEGFIAAITPVNVFYIARKLVGVEKARELVSDILTVFHVCTLDIEDLMLALRLPIQDFEDAVRVACAQSAAIDWIVTRNLDDFSGSTIGAVSAQELLDKLV
jgi:predicted nucleic acid-binding protein